MSDAVYRKSISIWRQVLQTRIDLTMLHALCQDLGIHYENLHQGGLDKKLVDFFDHLNRRGMLGEFESVLEQYEDYAYLQKDFNSRRYGLTLENLPPQAANDSPYKGLAVFEEKDADLYFGREDLVDEITAQVQTIIDHPEKVNFLAIVGASGSGKSSLARAGLIPALRPLGFPIHLITPTESPLESLAASLTEDIDSVTATGTLIDDLSQSEQSLYLYTQKRLKRYAGKPNCLILVIDQFEELFTLTKDATQSQPFIDNLTYALAPGRDRHLMLLITLRADFYHRLAWSDDMRRLLESQQKYIGGMSPAELELAIARPALLNGFEFAPGLIEQILADVGQEPGALPLLSHALHETWKHREGRRLTFNGYREAGGVKGAIARTADAVYLGFKTEAEKSIAQNIFLRLIQLGEGTADTRRRAPVYELVPSGTVQEEVTSVLYQLISARLITISWNEQQGPVIDVAHEALIREWHRLRDWLNEDREGARLRKKLTDAAAEWGMHNLDDGFLYRGTRLDQALEWQRDHRPALSELENRFLQASVTQREDEKAAIAAARRREEEAQAKALAQAEALRQQAEELAAAKEAESKQAARLAREAEAKQKIEEKARLQAENDSQKLRFRRNLARGFAVVAGILAVAAVFLALEAFRSRDIANANLLINRGDGQMMTDPLLGLALAIEGMTLAEKHDEADHLMRTTTIQKDIFESGYIHSFVGSVEQRNIKPHKLKQWHLIDPVDNSPALLNLANMSIKMLPDEVAWWQFSPNGGWLVVDYVNISDALIFLETGEEINFEKSPLVSSGFSPDDTWHGRSFAQENNYLINTKLNRSIDIPNGPIEFWNFSENSEWLVVDFRGAQGYLIHLETGNLKPLGPSGQEIKRSLFSSDSTWLMMNFADYGELINLETSENFTLKSEISSVQFSPQSALLVVDYDENPGAIYSLEEGQFTELDLPKDAEISDFGFSQNGSWLILDLVDENGLLLEISDFTPHDLQAEIAGWTFSADETWLVLDFAPGEKPDHIRNLNNQTEIPLTGELVGLEPSQNNSWLILDYQNKPGMLLNFRDGSLEQLSKEVSEYRFSDEESGLWIAYQDGTSELFWDLFGVRKSIHLEDKITTVHFLIENRLALASGGGTTYLIDLEWLTELETLGNSPAVKDLIDLACKYPLEEGTRLKDPDLLEAMRPHLNEAGLETPRACS